MQWTKILTPLLAASVLAAFAPAVQAQHSADDTLLQMQQAFRKGERKRLSELLPAIQSQRIERNGQTYEAPPEAWAWAVESMLCARDAGRLQTPLKSHGYLYEVLSKWQATAPPRGGVGGACLERTDQDPLAPQMRPQSASKASDGMSFFRAREQALLQKINT